jgi:hypothetical protein
MSTESGTGSQLHFCREIYDVVYESRVNDGLCVVERTTATAAQRRRSLPLPPTLAVGKLHNSKHSYHHICQTGPCLQEPRFSKFNARQHKNRYTIFLNRTYSVVGRVSQSV